MGELIFPLENVIGRGSFGFVHRGFIVNFSKDKNKTAVAIKKVLRMGCEDNNCAIQQEVMLLQAAKDHPNILRYIHAERDETFIYIVTELCQGTLEDYINGTYEGPRFKSDREILRQLTHGLAHLHKKKIVHRDIKPNNILVFAPSDSAHLVVFPLMKLADFGLSRILQADKKDFTNTNVTNPNGTRGWMAPEVYQFDRFDFKVDIWALGCIFAYILSEGNKHPFGDDPDKRVVLIKEKKPVLLVPNQMKKPFSTAGRAFELIKSMLMASPSERPSIQAIVKEISFLYDRFQTHQFLKLCRSFEDSPTCKTQFDELVKDESVDINAVTQNGESPLHLLCGNYCNDDLLDLVKLLLQNGACYVNAKTNNGETPLLQLCTNYKEENLIDILKFLIDNGADVKAKTKDTAGHRTTPLHALLMSRYNSNDNLVDLVELLIRNGANVNAKTGDEGFTPLHVLCRHFKNDNIVKLVELLVENKAYVKEQTKRGFMTPLHLLCKFYARNKHSKHLKELIRLLTRKGADINAKTDAGVTPLHFLCECGINDELIHHVGFLIDEGADVKTKTKNGWLPFHFLCRFYGNSNLINLLKTMMKGMKKTDVVRAKTADGWTPLHFLCHYYPNDNLINLVKYMKRKGADLHAETVNGETPLHFLCQFYKNDNLFDLISLLTQKGATDVRIMTKDGRTPLHLLCQNYKRDEFIMKAVGVLIENGANINSKSRGEGKVTPFYLLCEYYENDNLLDVVNFFIKNGADVSVKNADEMSPLHSLCKNGSIQVIDTIKLLVKEQGVKVVDRTKLEGSTPLHLLCQYYKKKNLIELVQLFIDYGADVNAKTVFQKTPLHLLCENYKHDNLIQIIELLIEKGAKLDVKSQEIVNPNYLVCQNYKEEDLIQLIMTKGGRTPLHLLCQNYNRDEFIMKAVGILIENGADINANPRDEGEVTPFHLLCKYYENDNLLDVVRFLIKNGADVNAKTADGMSSLHYLCKNESIQVIDTIKLLVKEHGVKVTDKTKLNGSTPLHLLCQFYKNNNLIDLVQLFIGYGAVVNAKTISQNTPLHLLCENYKHENLIQIIELLIEKGAKVDEKSQEGKTPLHVLCKNYPLDKRDTMNAAVALMISHGAKSNAKAGDGSTPEDILFERGFEFRKQFSGINNYILFR